ncbi:nitrate reductase molybdenum cofactor assembly chaperone [Andreprevotia chitinilytica]|uniref:nitrate reductase molybdenum cofactor assembly chaperone n=1 Tax=Andreprevotia chitinilytica TaxID=396808 RepID=UPI00055072A7|nr:nitrate reductase molybdenum cofactor assembly chaperone [Andreprevotia chitinilytica]
MNRLYRVTSALLSYPEQPLLDALGEIDPLLLESPATRSASLQLAPLTTWLAQHDLIALQENYVATFDRSPGHALHLFEHIHGEGRDRGSAMVDLLREYQQRGFEPCGGELPDYLPLFLEFLGQLPDDEAQPFLDDAIHVIAAIGERLARNGSPYAAIFDVLRGLTDVAPLPLVEPPVRDMDELLETFGPSPDGTEPLLKPALHAKPVQTVQFYPRVPA